MQFSIILSTCPKKEASKISNSLLKKKLVACVNIAAVNSSYWWKGKICKGKEMLLIAKTKKSLVKKVMNEIKSLHSYEVPEIIELSIKSGSKRYLDYISKVTK